MDSLRQCLIIDPMHPTIFDMLRRIGWQGVDVSDRTMSEILPLVNQYEGLFVRTRTRVDERLLGPKPTVKFVGRAGAGLDNLDVPFLEEHGIRIIHASEGNRDAVGEYTIGALLSLMRHIPVADAEVRQSVWLREENRGEELMGKTVGIIGFGNMGQAFARRLAGFECQVLAYDKYKKGFGDQLVRESTMEDLFEKADVLSLHVPLTPETRCMVDEAFLARFKKDIILVNSARGEIVTLSTLASGLKTGRIRGAVLDVLENEKLSSLSTDQMADFEFLKRQRNILFTPHIAGWTFESHIKINRVLVEKLQQLGI